MTHLKYSMMLLASLLLLSSPGWSFRSQSARNIRKIAPDSQKKETTSTETSTKEEVYTRSPLKPYRPWENGYEPVGMGGELTTSSNCAKAYVDVDGGEYGERAVMLMEEIVNSPLRAKFLDEPIPDIEAYCPGFRDDADGADPIARHNIRLNFWVNLFGRIASYESSCKINENRVCKESRLCGGHFRMPEDYDLRFWRQPRMFRSPGKDWDAQDNFGCRADYRVPGKVPKEFWADNPRNDTACAVETMGGMLCGNYNSQTERCTKPSSVIQLGGYWEELRMGRKIPGDILKFPICKGAS